MPFKYNPFTGRFDYYESTSNEAIDDRVAALLTEGKAIDLDYDDTGGTLTITGHSNQIIYNSSGGVGFLRFNSWSAVITYLALTGADTDIIIEQNETIPAGSYNLKRARFVGNNGLEYSAGGWTVTFGDNTTISAWETPSVRSCRLLSTSTTGNIFTSSNPFIVYCTSVSHIHSTSIPFFKFTGSGQCTVSLDLNARFQKLGGGVENIDVTSSAFACQLILYRGGGSSVTNDIFKSTNTVIYVDVVGNAANDLTNYPTTNSNLTAFNVNVNFVQATTTIYNPTTNTSSDSPVSVTRAKAVYLANAAGGNITYNLQAAGGNGVLYFFKKTDSSTNTVTIDGNSSETIDGATTVVLSRQNDAIAIIDTGSGTWHIIGDYRGITLLSGTYTPTRSAEANMDSNVTMTEAQYMRVGNTVTVSGRFTADPTLAATATSFEITLPIASNIGAAEDVAGVAFCGSIAAQGAEVIGVAANDTAKVQWQSGDITSQTWSYTFTYAVI